MKNKTLTYVLAGLLLWLPFLPLSAQKGREAKQVLDKAARAFKEADGIEASFTLTAYQHGTAQQSMKGSIRLQGEMFRLDTPDIITWFDGKTQWSYLTQNNEVNVANPTREELQSINPYSFLSLYKQGYNYKLGSHTLHEGTPVYEVNLLAEDPDLQIADLTIYIGKSDYRPLYIKVKEAGRSYNVITIDSYKSGLHWPKSEFAFDTKQYPDVEVIDLR